MKEVREQITSYLGKNLANRELEVQRLCNRICLACLRNKKVHVVSQTEPKGEQGRVRSKEGRKARDQSGGACGLQ